LGPRTLEQPQRPGDPLERAGADGVVTADAAGQKPPPRAAYGLRTSVSGGGLDRLLVAEVADDLGREVDAVGVTSDEEDAPDLADEAAGGDRLGLEPAGLGLADLDPREGPPQHRRGHQRGDDRDDDDDRVELDGEDAEAEADGGDDEAHAAASVHAEAHGEPLPVGEAGHPGAEVDAGDLASAGEAEGGEADERDLGGGDARKVDLDAGRGEEDRGEEGVGGHL